MLAHRHRDHLRGLRGIGLLVGIDREVVCAVAVVEELVAEDQRVVVAVAVEGSDRVRVVGPALIARDVTLDGPVGAAIERLIEAEHVVVALGADEPLGRADQMARIGRVDPDVGFRVVLDQHRGRGRVAGIAAGLGRIGTLVLAGGCSPRGARRLAVIAVVGTIAGRIRDLRRVAAHLLGRRENVRNRAVARRVRTVGLPALRHRADPGVCRLDWRRSQDRESERRHDDVDQPLQSHSQPPSAS